MKNFFFLIIYLAVLITLGGCIKDPCHNSYDIYIPLDISSYDSILHVGDTIRIHMLTENDRLYDGDGDRIVNIPNFDPRMAIHLVNLDSLPFRDVALETEILVEEPYGYTISNIDTFPALVLMTSIDTSDTTSEIDISFVLDIEPGTYAIHFFGDLYYASKDLEFENRCGNRRMFFSFLLPDEKIINLDILDEHQFFIDWEVYFKMKPNRELYSSYYFKLVE